MKKIIFIMPAVMLLAASALASGNDCRLNNKFYGAEQCEACGCGKTAKTGCYELNAFYGAKKCCSCELQEYKIKPVKGAARCHKEAKKADAVKKAEAPKAAPAAPAQTAAKAAPAQPAKIKEDLAKVATVTATDKGAKISFNTPILFGSASDKLADSSKEEIQKIAKVLKNHPDSTVIVEGYTDSIGNAEANVDLSKRRAKAVAQVMVDEGLPANKVGFKGYGAANPIATNATKEGRAQNRRVELDITVK